VDNVYQGIIGYCHNERYLSQLEG